MQHWFLMIFAFFVHFQIIPGFSITKFLSWNEKTVNFSSKDTNYESMGQTLYDFMNKMDSNKEKKYTFEKCDWTYVKKEGGSVYFSASVNFLIEKQLSILVKERQLSHGYSSTYDLKTAVIKKKPTKKALGVGGLGGCGIFGGCFYKLFSARNRSWGMSGILHGVRPSFSFMNDFFSSDNAKKVALGAGIAAVGAGAFYWYKNKFHELEIQEFDLPANGRSWYKSIEDAKKMDFKGLEGEQEFNLWAAIEAEELLIPSVVLAALVYGRITEMQLGNIAYKPTERAKKLFEVNRSNAVNGEKELNEVTEKLIEDLQTIRKSPLLLKRYRLQADDIDFIEKKKDEFFKA